jgi:asparagine synthase (glutamine-hydrolysing)
MCGIVGFTGPKSDVLHLRRMNTLQRHRGPDSQGEFFCEENLLHLGMRRLSIVDIEHGHQPMGTSDGRYWVVFNGEIFNAPALRIELENRGVAFKTDHSDTEVLLHLYAFEGADMVKKLNGMFAFAIYDKHQGKLFCARDPFGIKPFFYSIASGRFTFASELKSLRILPWISNTFDHQAIYHFFSFQAIPAPYTILSNARKLPAAHSLEWDISKKRLKIERYWTPNFSSSLPYPKSELPEYVRDEFNAAVTRWSMSDVPIACSLSGGLDSSTITAILANRQTSPIRTYCLGFDDEPSLDERDFARKTADFYGTKHQEIVLRSQDLFSDLDAMIDSLDEPYAGGLPSWHVFKEISKDAKVAMTGTGGDELFGNYGKWLPYQSPRTFFRSLSKYIYRGGGWVNACRFPYESHYVPQYFSDYEKQNKLFTRDFLNSVGEKSLEYLGQHWNRTIPSRNAITELDFSQQLAEEFLFMTDRFSMAHSLEVRTPFLDKVFVSAMLNIPPQIRSEKTNAKNLFKESMHSLLPHQLLDAPKKGFVIPENRWLSSHFLHDVQRYCSKSFLRKQNLFDPSVGNKFSQLSRSSSPRFTHQIWTWWMFQRWLERYQST